MTREEQMILVRAAEGGAFGEVADWVGSDEVTHTTLEDEELNRVYWKKLAEVAESLLGRPVAWEEFPEASYFFRYWNKIR